MDETGVKKLKILVVAPTPFFSDRGTHIRILEEALALEKRGHEVKIATYHIGSDLPEALGTSIDVRRIRRLLFWYKKLEAGPDWQKLLLDIMLVRKVFNLARVWRPDIIHGHLHEGTLIGWVVQKSLFWRPLRLVADFHGSLTREMVSHSYLRAVGLQRVFSVIERWIDNRGDAAVASSWDNADEINSIRTESRVVPVIDGTRLSMFDTKADEAAPREQYRIPHGKILIAYTGALIANKGIRLLLRAIPLVCERCPNAHFLIAGFPVDQIAAFLKSDVFVAHVTVVSPLPYFDLPRILGMSDIGVDPKEATTKQASGKMLQYMGAGLPVACFDTQNNREYLGDGGSYASTTTPEALAEAIIRLVRDPELRAVKGNANRERAVSFSWERSAAVLEDVYKKLI